MTTAQRRKRALQKRRDQAAELFARDATQADVAHALKVSRVTAMRWHRAWKRKGKEGLRVAARLGRPPALRGRDLERIDRQLRKGPQAHGYETGLWTLRRVAEVIEETTGVRFHIGHVGRVLHKMGWSLQRPTTKARERDEAAIRQWVKRRWPDLKKTSA
jgi:transposase